EGRCDPPLADEEIAKVARSIARYDPAPAAAKAQDDDPPLPHPHDVILEHFQGQYAPTFRRGPRIYSSALGREVTVGEACCGADMGLIAKLRGTNITPRDKDGVKENALPQFFKTWAPIAWKKMHGDLPEEQDTAEVDESAEEKFRGRVAAALLRLVTYG